MSDATPPGPLRLLLVAGRFLYKRWLRRRTRYFITTKRLITVRSVGPGMVEQAYIHDVGQIHRQKRGVNIGTIVFGSAPFAERQYGETGMEPLGGVPRNAVPIFSDVRDPEKALRAFEAAKQAS